MSLNPPSPPPPSPGASPSSLLPAVESVTRRESIVVSYLCTIHPCHEHTVCVLEGITPILCAGTHTHTHIHTHTLTHPWHGLMAGAGTHIYVNLAPMYAFMCVCVYAFMCVCVCVCADSSCIEVCMHGHLSMRSFQLCTCVCMYARVGAFVSVFKCARLVGKCNVHDRLDGGIGPVLVLLNFCVINVLPLFRTTPHLIHT